MKAIVVWRHVDVKLTNSLLYKIMTNLSASLNSNETNTVIKVHGRGEPFPPSPTIYPNVFLYDDAVKKWPGLAEILAIMKASCEAHNHAPTMVGLVTTRCQLGGMNCKTESQFGSVLVLKVPKLFGPSLTRLAGQKPVIFNQIALDLLTAETLYGWHCQLPDDREYSLMVPAGTMCTNFLMDFQHRIVDATGHSDFSFESEVFVPVVFIAGDLIACGGFWQNGDDETNAQCVSMFSNNYRHYRELDEQVLADAALVAEAAGSPTPWDVWPWLNERGIYELQFGMIDLPLTLNSF